MRKSDVMKLRLRVRKMISGGVHGEQVSRRQENAGFEFDTLRLYQDGDDVRRIDWNSSVRVNELMVRSYREQRNRRILLVLDFSASMRAGSTAVLKEEVVREIGIMLVHAAELWGDEIGIVLLSQGAVEYLPVKKGRAHSALCVEMLLKAQAAGTMPEQQCIEQRLAQVARRNTFVLCVTDGLFEGCERLVSGLAKRYVAGLIRVCDPYELGKAVGGDVSGYDPESAVVSSTLSSMHDVRGWSDAQAHFFKKQTIPLLTISPGESYDAAFTSFLLRGF